MAAIRNEGRLLWILQSLLVFLVDRDGSDLSIRQLSVFLLCYQRNDAQTVRGLAAQLNIPKASVSRALDRLEELHLARREVEPSDRRSVTVQRTTAGTAFMEKIEGMLSDLVSGELTALERMADVRRRAA